MNSRVKTLLETLVKINPYSLNTDRFLVSSPLYIFYFFNKYSRLLISV